MSLTICLSSRVRVLPQYSGFCREFLICRYCVLPDFTNASTSVRRLALPIDRCELSSFWLSTDQRSLLLLPSVVILVPS